MTNKKKQSYYFSAIDGLRFFAFLFVFILHFLSRYPVDVPQNILVQEIYRLFKYNGWVGVDLFFVISGFIITYLLLVEKQKNHVISLKQFFIRRILRIGPLYYLALFSTFIFIPFLSSFLLGNDYSNPAFLEQFKLHFLPFALFIGNFSIIQNGVTDFRNLTHLWTISTEMQFYLFWPFLLVFFMKNLKISLIFCLLLILFATCYRFLLATIPAPNPGIYMNTLARFDTFVYGGLIAILYFHKKINLNIFVFKNPFFIIVIIVGFLILLTKLELLYSKDMLTLTFGYSMLSAFFSYFLIVALIPQTFFSKFLSFGVLPFLGRISFGLYIWHRVGTDIGDLLIPSQNVFLIMIAGLLVTTIMAIASYYWVEKPFMNLKQKFTSINSRPN